MTMREAEENLNEIIFVYSEVSVAAIYVDRLNFITTHMKLISHKKRNFYLAAAYGYTETRKQGGQRGKV